MHQFAPQHGKHRHGQALDGFKHHVPDEAVTDHDIHMILEQVVTLDVADEIQIQLFAEPEGLERQFVALGVLGAVAEDADARIFAFQHFAGIDAAHHGKLGEVMGFAFHVGAGVQQHEFTLMARG
jgi:hypothetical protein